MSQQSGEHDGPEPEAPARRGVFKSAKRRTVAMTVVFMLGLSVFLFPMVADAINAQSQSYSVSSYDDKMAKLPASERDAIRRTADARNEELAGATPRMSDPFPSGTASTPSSHVDMQKLDEAIGHLEIPQIDLDLPIFEGDHEAVLQRGVGHIPNSSYPVGGTTTHSVLTGHRGQPTATLFRNLDALALGDVFFVHTLGQVMAYRVVIVETVLPTQFEKLRIVKGRDLVTLVTCTPYMINSHRLLVTGERIPYTEDLRPAAPVVPTPVRGWLSQWGPLLIGLVSAAVLTVGFGWFRRRRALSRGGLS